MVLQLSRIPHHPITPAPARGPAARLRLPARKFRWLAAAVALVAGCSDNPVAPKRLNHLDALDFPGATMTARIRAAIDALPETGGVVDATGFTGPQQFGETIDVGSDTKPVELRLGNVVITATVVPFRMHNHGRLIGNGLTVITQANGAGLEGIIRGSNVKGCEIAHLTIDGNRGGNTSVGSGIMMEGADGCWIHHLLIHNTVGKLHPAIYFYNPNNRNNTVEYNVIRDIGTLADYADGIYTPGPGNRVLFNRIDGVTDFGIVGEMCSGCVIQGNYITNTSGAITVGSGYRGTTAGANVVNGNVIVGGFATAWGMINVYRLAGETPVSTVIAANVVRDVRRGHGIMVDGAEQVAVADNVISDVSPTYDEAYGIVILNSSAVVVNGGSIQRTGSYGVGITNSTNVKVQGTSITDSGRARNEKPGVGLDVGARQSSQITLTGLTIYDTEPDPARKLMPYCIDFAHGGTTDGVLLGGNLFDDGVNATGCRHGNVRLDGASRVTTY